MNIDKLGKKRKVTVEGLISKEEIIYAVCTVHKILLKITAL